MNDHSLSVLLLVDRWLPGGVRKHVGDLHRAFRARDMDCVVAGWLPPDEQPPAEMEFFSLPLYNNYGSKSLSGFRKSATRLRKLLETGRFNVLHLHSRYVTLLAAAAAKGISLGRVYTVHNTFRNLRFLPWYPRNIICLNEAGKREFFRNYFLPRDLEVTVIPNGIEVIPNGIEVIPNGIEVIPNGIEIDPRALGSFRDTKYSSFAYIGRLEKQKGVELLLRAVAELHDTDIHVTIAGSGSEERALRILSRKLGLDSRV